MFALAINTGLQPGAIGYSVLSRFNGLSQGVCSRKLLKQLDKSARVFTGLKAGVNNIPIFRCVVCAARGAVELRLILSGKADLRIETQNFRRRRCIAMFSDSAPEGIGHVIRASRAAVSVRLPWDQTNADR